MSFSPLPRPEYPRPQFERGAWINLNGSWTCEFDFGDSGEERGLANEQRGFGQEITVPFCPESELSGIGHKDFINAMWYHRKIQIPTDWAGKKVILNFGAVDYECEAYIDGQSVGYPHYGGSSSFSFDITRWVKPGEERHLVVRVRDTPRSGFQTLGKQSSAYASRGCHYTRVTGIWQTVWLEAVAPRGLASCQIIPNLDGGSFSFTPVFHDGQPAATLRVIVKADGKTVGEKSVVTGNGASFDIALSDIRPWSPESPFLYDIEYHVVDGDGQTLDTVKSYAGLRKIHIEGNKVYLNNQPLYQRLVLDQGFYPDGIWTAPDDAALKRDIELSMAAGFNGARLHQKSFEERFHYWADKLGYLTWAESPSWGMNFGKRVSGDAPMEKGTYNFTAEWRELVVRDRNHPSIITWTPLNETIEPKDLAFHRQFHVDLYNLTKALDPTRPVNDTSGYVHARTDLYTVHNYATPNDLKEQLTLDPNGEVWRNIPHQDAPYTGQPYLVDEFGGIKWAPDAEEQSDQKVSWGYGENPQSVDEFFDRLTQTVDVLLGLEHVQGYCYTQLTDVEQEQNGIYNYDRSEKLNITKIKTIFSKTP